MVADPWKGVVYPAENFDKNKPGGAGATGMGTGGIGALVPKDGFVRPGIDDAIMDYEVNDDPSTAHAL